MRILLDVCLPRRLKRDLTGHEALTLAQSDFDVFLTVDRNLSFQQNVNKFNIAVVVLVAKSNKHAALQPLIPDVLSVLATLAPGQVVRVGT